MARSVRDIATALAILSGPDGIDGHVRHSAIPIGEPRELAGLRVGWAGEPAFGPIDHEVTATVAAAADALRELGCVVEPAALTELETLDSTALSAVLFAAEVVP